ncbi:sugar phosphate isomerase/epimerase family protein [Thalassoroseus pseudoceratinae]|uniref:sugar phosphate isomerase/epimerase family protein n=1 Tax=Thalassoroseus pseudoceratinae TaxID=2713176 RepID=UPI00141FB289|nr:sugar phosphate isomerase/epimerase family protein [Thalassoroseus pseudoceratinae]
MIDDDPEPPPAKPSKSSLVAKLFSGRSSAENRLEKTPDLKLSVNQITTYRWLFEDDIAGYRHAGIDGIGLWYPKLVEFGEDRAVDLLAESGLSVSSVSWVGGFTGRNGYAFDDAIREAKETIRTAARINAESVIVMSGSRAGHTANHARRLLIQGLDELAGFACEYGVRLAVQPMMRLYARDWTFLATLDETLAVLDECQFANVGMVFDAYHLWQEDRLLERIPEIAPRVSLLQLSDWHREPQSQYDQALIGDGQIPLDEILQAFVEAGYQRHCEVSVWSEELWKSDYEELLSQCRSRFDNLVAAPVS